MRSYAKPTASCMKKSLAPTCRDQRGRPVAAHHRRRNACTPEQQVHDFLFGWGGHRHPWAVRVDQVVAFGKRISRFLPGDNRPKVVLQRRTRLRAGDCRPGGSVTVYPFRRSASAAMCGASRTTERACECRDWSPPAVRMARPTTRKSMPRSVTSISSTSSRHGDAHHRLRSPPLSTGRDTGWPSWARLAQVRQPTTPPPC
jgi:hypothetical protein